MTEGAQDSPNLRSVFLLADQVEIGLRMTEKPTLWTPLRLLPEFPVACVLSALAIGTHLFLRSRADQLAAFADALTRALGADVVRLLRRTSSEIMEAFTFLRASGRKLPASFQSMEVLHIAFCALGFPAKEAMRRVIRYAFVSDAYQVIHRECFSGASRRAVQGDAGWAAVILAKGVFPEQHGKAWERIHNFWKPAHLLRSFAAQGKLPPSWIEFSREDDNPHKRLSEEMQAELTAAFGRLIDRLGQRDEDELLGAWLDGNPDVMFLAHAAKRDVENTLMQLSLKDRREPRLEDEALKHHHQSPKDDAEESQEAAADLVSVSEAATSPVHRGEEAEKPPDAFASAWVASERLERTLLRVFRHTKVERRLLKTILTAPGFDSFRHGAVNELADIVGCSRETASRYLSKLDRHKSAITKACLG